MATAFSLWRPSAGTQLLNNIFCKHNRRLGITNWISGRQDGIFKKERLTICGQKLWFLLVKWHLCFSHSCRDCLMSSFCHAVQSQGSSAAMGAHVSHWALLSGVSCCLSKIIPFCHVWLWQRPWKADSDASEWQPCVEMKERAGGRRSGDGGEKNPGKVRGTGCRLCVFVWGVSWLVLWLYLCYAVWFHCAQ